MCVRGSLFVVSILVVLSAGALAGCLSGPTHLEQESEMAYHVTTWPPGAPFIFLQVTPGDGEEQTATFDLQIEGKHEYRDESSISHDWRVEHDLAPAWKTPHIADLLVATPDGAWKSVGGPDWEIKGPWSPTNRELAHSGVDAEGQRLALYVESDLSTSSSKTSSSKTGFATKYHGEILLNQDPVGLLVYMPGGEYRTTREIRIDLVVPDDVQVELMEGTKDAILESYRTFPVGEGQRVEGSSDAPVAPPGSRLHPRVSQAEGTPVSFETTGTTLLFVHGLSEGAGISRYAYTPPDSDPVAVSVEVVQDEERQFTRTATASGDTPQYRTLGGIGPPGKWTFHLHSAECFAGEWGPTPIPSGQRSCMDTYQVADLGSRVPVAEGHLIRGPSQDQ